MSERNDEDDDHQDIVDSVSMPTADNRGTAQATGRCPDKVGQLSIMCRLDPRHTSVCCLSTVFSHLALSSCKFLFLQLEYYGIVRLGWHCLLSEDEGCSQCQDVSTASHRIKEQSNDNDEQAKYEKTDRCANRKTRCRHGTLPHWSCSRRLQHR